MGQRSSSIIETSTAIETLTISNQESISTMPDEIIHIIFLFLKPKSQRGLAITCRKLYDYYVSRSMVMLCGPELYKYIQKLSPVCVKRLQDYLRLNSRIHLILKSTSNHYSKSDNNWIQSILQSTPNSHSKKDVKGLCLDQTLQLPPRGNFNYTNISTLLITFSTALCTEFKPNTPLLSKFVRLNSLVLHCLTFNGNLTSTLSNFSSLEFLYLQECNMSQDDELSETLVKCTTIKQLQLRGNVCSLSQLLQLPPQLEKSTIIQRDRSIRYVDASNCTQLWYLEIRSPCKIELTLPQAPCLHTLKTCDRCTLKMNAGSLTSDNHPEKVTTVNKDSRIIGNWHINRTCNEQEISYLDLSSCRGFKNLKISNIKYNRKRFFVTFPPGDGLVDVKLVFEDVETLSRVHQIQLDSKKSTTFLFPVSSMSIPTYSNPRLMD